MEGRSYFFNAVLALFIILQVTTHMMNPCLAARPSPSPSNSDMQFIISSCQKTSYPQLCTSSLSNYAGKIHSSHEILAETALSIALATARSKSAAITKLSKTHGLKAREAAAMSDCVEELGDSVDELQMSIKEMKHSATGSFWLQMSNVQTWVSAALTYEDTCMDGFDEIPTKNGKVKDKVRVYVVRVEQMTSIALALINNYAAGHTGSP